MNTIAPARIGFLVDTARDPEHPYSEEMLPIQESRVASNGASAMSGATTMLREKVPMTVPSFGAAL